MLRLWMRWFCLVTLLGTASAALAQSEFSADIVDHTAKGNQHTTKVYFGNDKMRFDSMGEGNRGAGAVIMDMSTESYIVLMPQQHMYMEMPAAAMENRGMFSFFKSGDVDNACGDWLKLATNKGGTCHKDGSETMNGRSTVKYEGTNAKGESSTVWLDSKVRFPIKWDGKNGGGELQNIQEGSQPATLFQVPAGYTKMDMGGMMQHR